MKIKTLFTVLAMAAIFAVNAGQALAGFAVADTVIDWSKLTFSTSIASWDVQESFVEVSLDGETYTNQLADGFTILSLSDYNNTSEALAGTMAGFDGAYANVNGAGYAYAYADLFGTFTPDQDMTLTISFDYELFGEVSGNEDTFSNNYVFLLLGDVAFEDYLSLRGTGTDTITNTAVVIANLIAGQSYDFSMGASAEAGSTVPLPGAVWLLSTGLVGLVGIRRRSMK